MKGWAIDTKYDGKTWSITMAPFPRELTDEQMALAENGCITEVMLADPALKPIYWQVVGRHKRGGRAYSTERLNRELLAAVRRRGDRELTFLRFWRSLNATNELVELPDVPLGRAWRLFGDAFGAA